jgi:hypothetical protein
MYVPRQITFIPANPRAGMGEAAMRVGPQIAQKPAENMVPATAITSGSVLNLEAADLLVGRNKGREETLAAIRKHK